MAMENGNESFIFLLFNIAMGNGPFIDGLPIENGDFSMAMLNNQMVIFLVIKRMIFHSCTSFRTEAEELREPTEPTEAEPSEAEAFQADRSGGWLHHFL